MLLFGKNERRGSQSFYISFVGENWIDGAYLICMAKGEEFEWILSVLLCAQPLNTRNEVDMLDALLQVVQAMLEVLLVVFLKLYLILVHRQLFSDWMFV